MPESRSSQCAEKLASFGIKGHACRAVRCHIWDGTDHRAAQYAPPIAVNDLMTVA